MKISVTVKPKSREEKIIKTDNNYVVYIKEQPIENRANIAVVKSLARYFDMPKSNISIITGYKSKHKIIEIYD
jgi:uncharacterized protein YggU (UPF0235/DUF167 family)